MKRRLAAGLAVALSAALALSACSASSDSSAEPKTIKVAYQTTATFNQMQNLMAAAKSQYEKAHPGVTIELVPIQGESADYYTKLALMNQSAATAPDVQYEDTFKIQSDAAAGYLLPLDDKLAGWADYSQFAAGAKSAGLGADGKTYGVSLGTDTRALWYNKDLFAKAGITVPWEPKTWADVLKAASTIKAKLPDVIPFNVYSGKAAGEAASLQGFQMLLYGTKDTLYDTSSKKWVTGSQGFKDSLKFVQDVYQGGLGPTPQQALDPNIFTNVTAEWLPKSQLAIALDGSWQSAAWIPTGTNPWPEWSTVLSQAPMPTQLGDAPGVNSMSGGWTLAVGAKTKAPNLAFDFLTTALNQENSKSYDIGNSQIAVRNDVATDPEYTAANPSFGFFSSLVANTHFRAATEDYAQISNAITVAMEAVMTGQQSVDDAAAAYDQAVVGIVGQDGTQSAN
ncbi:carbohydrate ABC transporter substrate-binding protein, CUT1 family [Agreia bicolorata]|uniref:Carbohydrate ABC transporter substrate-binding protein, CUT1 family n=1 Tax=Agreia bicolorata TaxID=110935 RepID=A0A1T4XMJ0_9MICO|nr:extracellular solute-binding protein [Agreia bicolorata]KJC65075.1 sugar ABC transporter substrate-binding protein [Agreia bicolorata]SKA90762.1 carbohydrate ABC transporter substrate-binding protein, CUT1 family [Agreia bicolorata]